MQNQFLFNSTRGGIRLLLLLLPVLHGGSGKKLVDLNHIFNLL